MFTFIFTLLLFLIPALLIINLSTLMRKTRESKQTLPPTTSVLFVTAHPDDESMFFTPTITSLSSHTLGIVCLSEGQGFGRSGELLSAVKILSISPQRLRISTFKDGFKEEWDRFSIIQLVQEEVRSGKYDMVVTFDSYGISGHPNHRIIFDALKAASLSFPCYVLKSLPLCIKFGGWLWFGREYVKGESLVFWNRRVGKTWKAMMAHESQFLWFRKLFLCFSFYTYFNVLVPLEKG